MKRIYRPIKCDTDMLARQYTADYLARQSKSSDEPIDTRTKKLIQKYSEDVIAPSTNTQSFIRQAGPGLLEYLMERLDVTKSMVPSIFDYFVKYDTQVVANKRIKSKPSKEDK